MEAMDFMDPRRRLRHNIMLAVGYVLIGIALLLLTVILLFVAYGFGLQNGKVIQNGLLFLSSTPNPAQIYVDGARYKNDTNTKLVLPAGNYSFALKRTGYRDWSRSINVQGGVVESYAYPFLFPTSLTTDTLHSYAGAPALTTESADQHWLLVEHPDSLTSFDLYDLTDVTKQPVTFDLPATLLTSATGTQKLEVVAWADDNDHILLKHTYDGNIEYLLTKRSDPNSSINLTKTLNFPLTSVDVRLRNNKYDQYIIDNTATQELFRASLGAPTLQSYLKDVVSFATYGDNTILYVTPDTTDASKVNIMISDGDHTYVLHRDASNTTYLLDIASYSGDQYVGVSAASEGHAYVYKNPLSELSDQRLGVAVPAQIFNIKNANYVAFSTNAQYLLFENGTSIATYDAENDQGFSFTSPDPIDAPATHVSWMDSARLTFVSRGQVVAMDYDGLNRQVLVSADPTYDLAFDSQYKFLYAFVPSTADKANELLTTTSLRTPADQ